MIALPGPFSAGNGSLGEPGLIPGPFWTPTPNLPAVSPRGSADGRCPSEDSSAHLPTPRSVPGPGSSPRVGTDAPGNHPLHLEEDLSTPFSGAPCALASPRGEKMTEVLRGLLEKVEASGS